MRSRPPLMTRLSLDSSQGDSLNEDPLSEEEDHDHARLTGKWSTLAGRAAAPAEPAGFAPRWLGCQLCGLGEGGGVAEGFGVADVVAGFAGFVVSVLVSAV